MEKEWVLKKIVKYAQQLPQDPRDEDPSAECQARKRLKLAIKKLVDEEYALYQALVNAREDKMRSLGLMLETVPQDVLCRILSHLDLTSIGNLRRTCKHLNDRIVNGETIETIISLWDSMYGGNLSFYVRQAKSVYRFHERFATYARAAKHAKILEYKPRIRASLGISVMWNGIHCVAQEIFDEPPQRQRRYPVPSYRDLAIDMNDLI